LWVSVLLSLYDTTIAPLSRESIGKLYFLLENLKISQKGFQEKIVDEGCFIADSGSYFISTPIPFAECLVILTDYAVFLKQ